MSDSHVTIDPGFGPPSGSARGPGRWLGWIRVAALAAMALVFGWLMWSPAPPETEPMVGAAATTEATVAIGENVAIGEHAAIGEPDSAAILLDLLASGGVPLAELVPGFTDTITMLLTPPESFDVVRWSAASPGAEILLSLDRSTPAGSGTPMGLDASGNWFAQSFDNGVLAVHPVPFVPGDWLPREVLGPEVVSPVWHDTDPGRLAWLKCVGGFALNPSLVTYDVFDESAWPVASQKVERGCESRLLSRWGDWGAVLVDVESGGLVLLDTEGFETPVEETGLAMPDSEPNGWLSFGAPRGYDRAVGRAVASDESVVQTLGSPNGAHVAMMTESSLRLLDTASGTMIAEYKWAGSEVVTMVWSGDGRFLVYETWDGEVDTGALVFCDTTSNTTTTIPLASIVDELRVQTQQAPRQTEFSSVTAVDRASVDGRSIRPTSTDHEPPSDGIVGWREDATARLPVGERTSLPDSHRLDFLHTVLEGDDAFRDAVVVDRSDNNMISGTWRAGEPFHVRQGFVNEAVTPLGDGFDVVVYVTRRQGPQLGTGTPGAESFDLDVTYRFVSDYVVRGTTERCGPGYWDQTEPATCEWFVHEFPDGLPPGRYDIWARWFAPCSAWRDFGLEATCSHPAQATSRFASSVNMPFYGNGFVE